MIREAQTICCLQEEVATLLFSQETFMYNIKIRGGHLNARRPQRLIRHSHYSAVQNSPDKMTRHNINKETITKFEFFLFIFVSLPHCEAKNYSNCLHRYEQILFYVVIGVCVHST